MDATITFTVNREQRTVSTDPRRPLLEVLREDLRLTGTKYGCGQAQCGACTVLIDGRPAYSCTLPVSEVAGKSIITIEGLSDGQTLHPVQQAFASEGAYQCGYCTPGMILATVALLERNPDPTEAQVIEALDGHLCRCCGYARIIKTVRLAAVQMSLAGSTTRPAPATTQTGAEQE